MGDSSAPRVHKHLTGHEVERLIAAIKESRNEKRDRRRVLLLEQVDTENRVFYGRRLKDGIRRRSCYVQRN